MGMLDKHPDFTKGKRTKKVPKQETDVNQIVKRFEKTGQLPPGRSPGTFADVSRTSDLRSVLQRFTELKKYAADQERVLREKLKGEKGVSQKVDSPKGSSGAGGSGVSAGSQPDSGRPVSGEGTGSK